MSDPQAKPQWAGNALQRVWRTGVQGALPGDQRAADGTLNNRNVLLGLLGRVGSVGASLFGGPLVGAATNRLAGNMIDTGNPLNFTRPSQGISATAPQMPISASQFPINPQLNGAPQGNLGLPSPGMATMPTVNAQPPPTPLEQWASLGAPGANLLNGGALGAWANGSVPARPIGGGLSFGANSMFNNGVGAGTGYGATNYTNDASGLTAAGFGIGPGNSGFANRQVGADNYGRSYMK